MTIHRGLEAVCARLVVTEAALSLVSCWNANEAIPASLLTENLLIISDRLNHAWIIDTTRLGKSVTECQTGVFEHGDIDNIDLKIAAAADRRLAWWTLRHCPCSQIPSLGP